MGRTSHTLTRTGISQAPVTVQISVDEMRWDGTRGSVLLTGSRVIPVPWCLDPHLSSKSVVGDRHWALKIQIQDSILSPGSAIASPWTRSKWLNCFTFHSGSKLRMIIPTHLRLNEVRGGWGVSSGSSWKVFRDNFPFSGSCSQVHWCSMSPTGHRVRLTLD